MSDDLVKRIDSLMVLLNMEREKSLSLGKHIEKLETANLRQSFIMVDHLLRIETLEAALYEIVHINNMRDRFSSEIDNVITTVMGEKNANA